MKSLESRITTHIKDFAHVMSHIQPYNQKCSDIKNWLLEDGTTLLWGQEVESTAWKIRKQFVECLKDQRNQNANTK